MPYQSWHLHTKTPPYCQTWTETNTYSNPADGSEQARKRLKLPKAARVGPFYYTGIGDWKADQKKHAAELRGESDG